MKVKKGDTVRVITGKWRDEEGEVIEVDRRRNRVIVEGVNVARKHARPRNAQDPGGIIDKLLPIDVSNVMVVCPKTGKPGRVGYRFDGDLKIRYHKASGEDLP
jgi:large subunit ribosomal protein L24